MRRIIAFVSLLVGMMLLGAGVLAAQEATPVEPAATPRPVELACTLEDLQNQQRVLNDLLGDFSTESEANPGAALDNLYKVGAAYQELALACGYLPPDAAERPVGDDIERILAALETVNGDPLNGQSIYNGDYACAGCHLAEGHVAPPTEGTYTRVLDVRLMLPEFADYTAEQYLIESIVNPAHYIVPDYNPSMPGDYGKRITLQEMADLVLFLESQDGPSPE